MTASCALPALVEAVAAAGMPRHRARRPGQPVRDGEVLQRGAEARASADRRRGRTRARSDDPARDARLILLCQDRTGYRNLLLRLLTRAQVEGRRARHRPATRRAWLSGATDGLIALSGAATATSDAKLIAEREGRASQALDAWLELFGDRFYLELQRTGRPGEDAHTSGAVALAARRGVPVVATNDVRFLGPGRLRGARSARLHPGRASPRRPPATATCYSPQQYLRSPEQMAELLPRSAGGAREQRRDRAPVQPRAAARRQCSARISRSRGNGRGRLPRAALHRTASEWRIASGAIGAPIDPYRTRLAEELKRDRRHGLRRLLPHRRRLHRAGRASTTIPVGSGPRLGRRLARRLCARHHRSRSARARPAVRAFPES